MQSIKIINQRGVQSFIETANVFVCSGLPGVDVCGTATVVINHSSLEWQWEKFGLKLHVRDNALPAGIEQCHININASLSGHYEFPDDHHLVSTIFWFQCDPPCTLAKSITVELQHCAISHNVSKLRFVKAVCTQEQLPYIFHSVARGSFSEHSYFGSLEMKRFSGVGIIQEGSPERKYLSTLLYKEERFHGSGLCFLLYFVVTWNTVTHQTVC